MARSRFEIQDSFENIFRDLGRVGSDAATEMRKELGVAVGDIIDNTPQDTGMAASGWLAAASALQSKHGPIKDGEAWSTGRYDAKKKGWDSRVIRSAAWGRRMGKYQETVPFAALKRAIKRGDLPDKLEFIAENAVRHMTFLEYGVSYFGGRQTRGETWRIAGLQAHYEETINGFNYAMKPRYIVRNAMRRFKQHVGPAFSKVLRANIKRPKRYKRTVVS